MYKSVTLALAGLLTIWGNANAAVISCLQCNKGTIDFYLGTPLPAANEQQIFLDKNTTNKTSFIGNVGSQNGLPTTQFTTDVAVDLGNGFANVKPTNKDDKIGTLTFSVPGFLFGDFLFDVQLDSFDLNKDNKNLPYPLSIVAYDAAKTSLGSWTFGPGDANLKPNADLSFLVLSASSNIDSVVITSLLGANEVHGMLELKHFQVSELQDPVTDVPEPSTLGLIGLGLLGLGAMRRRRNTPQRGLALETRVRGSEMYVGPQ